MTALGFIEKMCKGKMCLQCVNRCSIRLNNNNCLFGFFFFFGFHLWKIWSNLNHVSSVPSSNIANDLFKRSESRAYKQTKNTKNFHESSSKYIICIVLLYCIYLYLFFFSLSQSNRMPI